MRNIVCQVVKLAEFFECAIAIESLDFSKKKAKYINDATGHDIFQETIENHQ
ncbi:MAG: hypothetical protein F6K24_28215 [Okeania sp. SIO2D1]|nr:hypothetical protein [Okeania sp. SIO2D1]